MPLDLASDDRAQQLLRRHDQLASERALWEGDWRRIAERVLPRAEGFSGKMSKPAEYRQYDSFPQQALTRFGAVLESGLTPRAGRWFTLTTGDEDFDGQVEIREYLEACASQIGVALYSPRANFAGQLHELYLSLGAFGIGAMLIEAAPGGGVRYRNIPLSQLYVAANAQGMIDTAHRKFTLDARQSVQQFGEAAPRKAHDAAGMGNPHMDFEYVQIVQPREDFERGALDGRGMPYSDITISVIDRRIVREGGHHEFPYVVPRYLTAVGECYGRGPGHMALPDIEQLNVMIRTMVTQAEIAVDPPIMLFDDERLNSFKATPGARNFGGVDEQGRILASPFHAGSNFSVGESLIQKVRDAIDDMFLGLYYRLLPEQAQYMTATLGMLLRQQQGQLTAPVIGRLQSELLSPLIRRTAGILIRQGGLPQAPDALLSHIKQRGEPLGFEYESPLSLAAKSEEGISVLRTFEALAPLAQADPSVMQVFDMAEAARVVARSNGMPARVMRSREDLAAMQEQQAQQAEMASVLQAAPVAADAAKTMVETQALAAQLPNTRSGIPG